MPVSRSKGKTRAPSAPGAGRAPARAARAAAERAMNDLVGARRALIGMIHLAASPGAPAGAKGVDALVAAAVDEARTYADAGFNALMMENMHDRPYSLGHVGPEVVAAMTAAAREITRNVALPLGVQVLAGANREALAIAVAAGAAFIRAEGFVFAHVADEGLMQANAGTLLRYRREIGAEHVRVFADIKKKHASHAITADVGIAETARAAAFNLADGVVVTGVSTGEETDAGDVAAAAEATALPVLVGSGVTPANLGGFARADGFIVGSSVKQGGVWSAPLDGARAKAIAQVFRAEERRR